MNREEILQFDSIIEKYICLFVGEENKKKNNKI